MTDEEKRQKLDQAVIELAGRLVTSGRRLLLPYDRKSAVLLVRPLSDEPDEEIPLDIAEEFARSKYARQLPNPTVTRGRIGRLYSAVIF